MKELQKYLEDCGYNSDDAEQFHDAYYRAGIESALDLIRWADDEIHDYSGELRDNILKWLKGTGEITNLFPIKVIRR